MDTPSVTQRDWSRFNPDDKDDRRVVRLEILAESRRPAYSPAMVRTVGPIAALYICQLVFWDGKGMDDRGFIYKSEAEFEQETGLTRNQQRKARKTLKTHELLDEERRSGVPPRNYYRANLPNFAEIVAEELQDDPERTESLSDESDEELDELLIDTQKDTGGTYIETPGVQTPSQRGYIQEDTGGTDIQRVPQESTAVEDNHRVHLAGGEIEKSEHFSHSPQKENEIRPGFRKSHPEHPENEIVTRCCSYLQKYVVDATAVVEGVASADEIGRKVMDRYGAGEDYLQAYSAAVEQAAPVVT